MIGGDRLSSSSLISDRPRLGPGDAVIDQAFASSVLPRRQFGAHKWGVGGLVIVAGAPGYAGAAALSAMAANRAGAGIINVALPRSIANVVVNAVPEAAVIPLPESEAANTGRRATDLIAAKLAKSTALLIGPGLSEDDTAGALLGALLGIGGASRGARLGFGFGTASPTPDPAEPGIVPAAGKPFVLDADALNWLAKQDGWWDALPPGKAVLTPHLGEMSRLLARDADEIAADPIQIVRTAAREWGQVVVFKYGYTAVSDGNRVLVAADAPLSLATAGSGDVFAGAIAAFLAQGLQPFAAAALAIHVGTKAARRVERTMGTLGLVATDLPVAIAQELAALEFASDAHND